MLTMVAHRQFEWLQSDHQLDLPNSYQERLRTKGKVMDEKGREGEIGKDCRLGGPKKWCFVHVMSPNILYDYTARLPNAMPGKVT